MEPRAVRRVLVAIDDSEASLRAAEFANEFFAELPVEVLVVNATPVSVSWYPGARYGIVAPSGWPQPYQFGDASESDRERLLGDAKEHGRHIVDASGIDGDDTIVDVGDPVEVIRRAADDHDVDLIVVGTSDKGWWGRLLEGSVSNELVKTAHRPVLVVR